MRCVFQYPNYFYKELEARQNIELGEVEIASRVDMAQCPLFQASQSFVHRNKTQKVSLIIMISQKPRRNLNFIF